MLLCWLGLLVVRVAERSTAQTWRRITLLDRLHEVTLAGPAAPAVHTSEPNDVQRDLLAACQLKPPPRVTHLDPT